MDCQRAANLMMKYFDHAIGDLEEKEMTLHMKGCSSCRLDFQWMKEAICSVEEMEELEAPEDFESMVMASIPIDYHRPSTQKNSFFPYGAVMVAMAAVFVCGMLYLRYATVDFGEIHHLMSFVFTMMDLQGVFQNLAALASKNMVRLLIFVIRCLNTIGTVLINTRMNVYLIIVGTLCSIFVGIQHWLVHLTYEAGYRGGKIYEK